MKKVCLILLLSVMAVAAQADITTQPYITGDFNGWDPGAIQMTETSSGSGIWEYTITGLAADQYQQFKITDGTWGTTVPASNSWYNADGSGEVPVTFDTNVYGDGWLPAQNRIRLTTEPGSWSVVGDFNGWNNADPTMVMTPQGGGIYKLTKASLPGTYQWKGVKTGTWDAIGANGRGVDASNMELTVTTGDIVNFYIDALNGILKVEAIPDPADPDPANYSVGIQIDALTLSWDVARDSGDPCAADPDLLSHELYMTTATDPNLSFVDAIASWDPCSLRAEHTLSSSLSRDAQYFWFVKEIRTSGDLDGLIWQFDTEKSTPVITEQPGYQVVVATATADFTITVTSISSETYQWYKVDDAGDITLSDAGDISGTTTDTLSIANVELTDEGAYYCIINNLSGIPTFSDDAVLGVKRMIANWSFESGSSSSDVAGSPGTWTHGDPTFVDGNVGDGMSFDGNDTLYVDPNSASYFDICNFTTTVSCWVKSSSAATWNPLVSRHGDNNQGWQFRHNGNSLDKISLTTRGITGNEDGTPSDKTVFDGNWHHAVATYDGAEKKVYIDGVLSATDTASGLINPTVSPVAMAGRVVDNAGNWEFQGFMTCVLDDVSIYNYALSANTIAQTYADITQTNVCPENPLYDLDGDCRVTLADLTLLALEWTLDNTVYPN